jgi:ATP-binding cassette subfamily B multidrug efflux pump
MKKKNIILKILSELSAYPKWFYTAIALTLLISLISIVRPLLINTALNNISTSNVYDFTKLGIFLVLLMMMESLLQYSNSVISVILGQKLVLKTRKNLFEHILHLPISYFDKTPVGTVAYKSSIR